VRITRLYHPENISCGDVTQLSKSASNHIIRVLRSKVGTQVILFNGDGYDYHGRLVDNHAKKTSVQIEEKVFGNSESNLSITLIQGLSRNDRMETTVQKSVELGVNKIIPISCQRSNTKLTTQKQEKKQSYWQSVMISACEQSGRNQLAELTEIKSIDNISTELDANALKILLHPSSVTSLKEINIQHHAIEVFIGPEGGLNDDEIDVLQKKGFQAVCFGPRILRTETAGPAVISALQVLWGDC